MFKLWGETINIREQQDAFDFLQALIDQIDEHIKVCSFLMILNRWVNDLILLHHILLNSVSVISGQWMGDYRRQCVVQHLLVCTEFCRQWQMCVQHCCPKTGVLTLDHVDSSV